MSAPGYKTPFISRTLERTVTESFSMEIADRVRTKQAVMLDPNNTLEFQHGRRWETPANELGDQSGEVEQHSFEMSVRMKEIVAGNPAIIFERAELLASEMHNSFERMMFLKLSESTERVGNVVNAAELGSFPEAFAQMLEKIEMSVDEQGTLQLPTMVVAPEQGEKLMAQLKTAGPEFEKRIEKIKERKREQALERERQRVERFERRSE